jgi:mono/diheme cytochrome c family protein
MSVRARAAAAAGLAVAAVLLVGQAPADPKPADAAIPVLGAELPTLPAGPVKALADQACLHCHSADMIRQQRLTEKQWTAEVTKMAGWGAAVPEDQRAALIAYLVANFGPDNDRFQPVVVQPLGR